MARHRNAPAMQDGEVFMDTSLCRKREVQWRSRANCIEIEVLLEAATSSADIAQSANHAARRAAKEQAGYTQHGATFDTPKIKALNTRSRARSFWRRPVDRTPKRRELSRADRDNG